MEEGMVCAVFQLCILFLGLLFATGSICRVGIIGSSVSSKTFHSIL